MLVILQTGSLEHLAAKLIVAADLAAYHSSAANQADLVPGSITFKHQHTLFQKTAQY
jgi:hypothetical protein